MGCLSTPTSTFSFLPSVCGSRGQISRQVPLPLGFQWVWSWREPAGGQGGKRSQNIVFFLIPPSGVGSVPQDGHLRERWLLFKTPSPISPVYSVHRSFNSLLLLLDCAFLLPSPDIIWKESLYEPSLSQPNLSVPFPWLIQYPWKSYEKCILL